jgi:hypothetical protein
MGTVTITLTGDDARAIAAMQRVLAKQEEMGRKALEAGQKSAQGSKEAEKGLQDAGKAAEESFGSAALGKLAGYGVGLAGIGIAVKLVTESLNEMQAAAQAAGQRAQQELPGLVQLQMRAKGNAGEVKRLEAIADAISLRSGMSREKALELTAALPEAALQDTGLVAAVPGYTDIAAPWESARALQMGLGPAAGSVQEILSQGLAMGEPEGAPGRLAAAAKSAAYAKRLGINKEDLLAAVSVASEALGGPEAAGAGLEGLLKYIARRPGMEGKGLSSNLLAMQAELAQGKKQTDEEVVKLLEDQTPLAERRKLMDRISKFRERKMQPDEILASLGQQGYGEQIQKLQYRPYTEAERMGFFGRGEGYATYEALMSHQDELTARSGQIAGSTGMLERIATNLEADPHVRSANIANQLKRSKELTQRRSADISLLLDAAFSRWEEEEPGLLGGALRSADRSLRWAMGDEMFLNMAFPGGTKEIETLANDKLARRLEEALRRGARSKTLSPSPARDPGSVRPDG